MNTLIKKVCCFSIILILGNCKSVLSQNATGSYSVEKRSYASKLVLLGNGTFEYFHKEKLAEQYSKGTWIKKNDEIILNNSLKYKSGIESSNESYDESVGAKIILKDNLGDPLFGFGVTVNGNHKVGWSTDESGIVEFKDHLQINNIMIHYLNEKYEYIIDDSKNNVFKLIIKPEKLSIRYFNNEKFKLTKKGIEDSEGILYKKN